jgi:hypothetical protein
MAIGADFLARILLKIEGQAKAKAEIKALQAELKTLGVAATSAQIKSIRGLLCSKCNIILGYFNDKISFLKNAIDYLKKARK